MYPAQRRCRLRRSSWQMPNCLAFARARCLRAISSSSSAVCSTTAAGLGRISAKPQATATRGTMRKSILGVCVGVGVWPTFKPADRFNFF